LYIYCTCCLSLCVLLSSFFLFFFTDPATTVIYTLSLHDALPIYSVPPPPLTRRLSIIETDLGSDQARCGAVSAGRCPMCLLELEDRKSTRLNSSHVSISYAVFCLKKKKINIRRNRNV